MITKLRLTIILSLIAVVVVGLTCMTRTTQITDESANSSPVQLNNTSRTSDGHTSPRNMDAGMPSRISEGSVKKQRNEKTSVSTSIPAKTILAAPSSNPQMTGENDDNNSTPTVYHSAVDVLRNKMASQFSDGTIFKTTTGEIALAVKGNEFVLALTDGTVMHFTASEEHKLLYTKSGSACSFIAAGNNYSVGRLGQNAYLIAAPDGYEYTLGVPQANEDSYMPFTSEPQATPTMTAIASLKASLPDDHSLYTSADKRYAIVVKDRNYSLVSPDGSTQSFTPATEKRVLVTPSRSACPFIAGNDSVSVGQIAQDTYVVVTDKGQEEILPFIAEGSQYSVITDEEDGTVSLQYNGIDTKPEWTRSMSDKRTERQLRYGITPGDPESGS